MIPRREVLARSIEGWPKGGVPYSMSLTWNDDDGRTDEDGWRRDCSGYVGMCWMVPKWTNTVTLVTEGYMKEIPQSELRPGDAIGNCGPGTAGAAGHIMLWVGREPNGLHRIREQAGGISGWRERVISWPKGYKAYRCTSVIEDAPEEDDDMKMILIQDNTGVALQFIHPTTGELAWVNAVSVEAVEGWKKAGVPLVKVGRISQHGKNADQIAKELRDAMKTSISEVRATPGPLKLTGTVTPA